MRGRLLLIGGVIGLLGGQWSPHVVAGFSRPASAAAQPPAAPAGKAAAPASPMAAPKLPPFAGEVVSFDRRGEKIVACVDAAAAPPSGKPGGPLPPKPAPGSVPPRYRIWILEREVMQELLSTAGLCDPRWAPDGTRFVAAGVRGVFVFTAPNYESTVVAAGQAEAPAAGAPPARSYDDPVWSPSGSKLAYLVSGGTGPARVEVVEVKSAQVLLRREGAAKVLGWADERTVVVDGTRVPLP